MHMHRPGPGAGHALQDTIDMRDQHQLRQQQAQAAGSSSSSASSSLFLLRNPLAAASRTMRRGIIRGFCHGVASTSTQHHLQLAHGGSIHEEDDHQKRHHADAASSSFLTVPSSCGGGAETESSEAPQVTLEQMILQLDLEEAKAAATAAQARKERRCGSHVVPRRMSCVDRGSADRVLRDALSQYPRFSLDGRDAAACRASFSSYRDAGGGMGLGGYEMGCLQERRMMPMPDTVAGESVVWCEPGVVAKLMGLDSVPVPIRASRPRGAVVAARWKARGPLSPPVKTTTGSGFGGVRKEIRPRRTTGTGSGKEELEKERLFMALHGYGYGYGVAEAGACHAGGQRRTAVGPNVSRFGREGRRWEFRFPS